MIYSKLAHRLYPYHGLTGVFVIAGVTLLMWFIGREYGAAYVALGSLGGYVAVTLGYLQRQRYAKIIKH